MGDRSDALRILQELRQEVEETEKGGPLFGREVIAAQEVVSGSLFALTACEEMVLYLRKADQSGS